VKSTRLVRSRHLALLVLLLAACGATQTTSPLPAASSTAGEASVTAAQRVDYRGVSFTYDLAIATPLAHADTWG
jgi:uncharacterized lipoprotein YbaY